MDVHNDGRPRARLAWRCLAVLIVATGAVLLQFAGLPPIVGGSWAVAIDRWRLNLVTGDVAEHVLALQQLRWLHADAPADAFEITPERAQSHVAELTTKLLGIPGLVGVWDVGPLRVRWAAWPVVWFLLVIFAAAAVMPPLVQLIRVRRRMGRGLCAVCGYDLRGSEAAICPECGAVRLAT